MTIVLLVMTDGRDDLLEQTIASAKKKVDGHITRGVIHTDAGLDHRDMLTDLYPRYEVIGGSTRLGFGGAIDRAWRNVWTTPGDERFVFHLEDDFTFNRRVNLDDMVSVMEHEPDLVQMALRRQAVSEGEAAAGGVVEQWPESYLDVEWGGFRWLEHRLFVTTNPALWRIDRCREGWPVVQQSEALYGAQVFANPDLRCGYWGARDSGEAVHHIGEVRAGVGY